jgi:hypothetical protein
LNDNYIICTEKGIHLYDSQIENLISENLFSTEISSSDFTFVNIEQYTLDEGGYVIIIYKEKFYLYSYSGALLFPCDLTLSPYEGGYTLVPYKKDDSYNFILGYLDSNQKTMINYYKINIPGEEIVLISTKNILIRSESNTENYDSPKELSCQIMTSIQRGMY